MIMSDEILNNQNTKQVTRPTYDGFDFDIVERGIYSASINDKEQALSHIEAFSQNCISNNYAYGKLTNLIRSDINLSKKNPSQFLIKMSTRIGNDIGSLIMSLNEYSESIETLIIMILNKKTVLTAIFGASIYNNTDHFVKALITQIQQQKLHKANDKRLFLLILGVLYNLNSQIEIERIFKYFTNNKHLLSSFCM